MDEKELDNKAIDLIVSGASAAVGSIPCVGGFLSAAINISIPNQRIDRIVKFIKEINEKLQELSYSVENLEKIFSNYKYGAFTYSCIRSVVNEMYEEKIDYYKALCIKGLTSDEKELNRCEKILKILDQMDYFEIIFLEKYYYIKQMDRNKLIEIDKKLNITFPDLKRNKTDEERTKDLFDKLSVNNLLKQKLIEESNNTYKYKINELGELILKEIGVI